MTEGKVCEPRFRIVLVRKTALLGWVAIVSFEAISKY